MLEMERKGFDLEGGSGWEKWTFCILFLMAEGRVVNLKSKERFCGGLIGVL